LVFKFPFLTESDVVITGFFFICCQCWLDYCFFSDILRLLPLLRAAAVGAAAA
jgi:hypothetical protein